MTMPSLPTFRSWRAAWRTDRARRSRGATRRQRLSFGSKRHGNLATQFRRREADGWFSGEKPRQGCLDDAHAGIAQNRLHVGRCVAATPHAAAKALAQMGQTSVAETFIVSYSLTVTLQFRGLRISRLKSPRLHSIAAYFHVAPAAGMVLAAVEKEPAAGICFAAAYALRRLGCEKLRCRVGELPHRQGSLGSRRPTPQSVPIDPGESSILRRGFEVTL